MASTERISKHNLEQSIVLHIGLVLF